MLGEANRCRIKDCSGKVVPDARDKHGAGFQGLCVQHIESQKDRETKTGQHSKAINRIHGRESLATRVVKDLIS